MAGAGEPIHSSLGIIGWYLESSLGRIARQNTGCPVKLEFQVGVKFIF